MAMRLTRKTILLASVILAGVTGYLLGRVTPARPSSASVATNLHTGLTIEQIQQLSTLVTTRVDVADVQVSEVNGYTGGLKVALVIKGDFLLGVDLTRARFESVDPEAKTAVLVLPLPAASSPRLDHARTQVFAVSDHGLWTLVPGDAGRSKVIDRAYAEAQAYVAASAADAGRIDNAKQQAERVLATFFGALQWTVSVRWAE